jgi:HAD superfamily hydrolase (TIGR01509 family)
VLLDVDGTLLLSNDLHAETWAEALAEAGHDVPAARVRRLIGMGGDKLLPELGIDVDDDRREELAERKKALFAERLPSLQPAPGARALLERLRADGQVLVVATSAEEDEVRGLLRQAGVDDLIERHTTASDVENSKPDPDIVTAAARRSGLPLAALVMLGDTPYDVAAATAAGVAAVAVRCGGWEDDALAGAAAVYDDPAHLLREFERSPLVAPQAASV